MEGDILPPFNSIILKCTYLYCPRTLSLSFALSFIYMSFFKMSAVNVDSHTLASGSFTVTDSDEEYQSVMMLVE